MHCSFISLHECVSVCALQVNGGEREKQKQACRGGKRGGGLGHGARRGCARSAAASRPELGLALGHQVAELELIDLQECTCKAEAARQWVQQTPSMLAAESACPGQRSTLPSSLPPPPPHEHTHLGRHDKVVFGEAAHRVRGQLGDGGVVACEVQVWVVALSLSNLG